MVDLGGEELGLESVTDQHDIERNDGQRHQRNECFGHLPSTFNPKFIILSLSQVN